MNNRFSLNRRRLLHAAAWSSVAGLSVSACAVRPLSYLSKEAGFDEVSPILYWSDVMLQAVRDLALSPIEASRVYALAHLSGSIAMGNTHSALQSLSLAMPSNLNLTLAFGVAFSLACEEGLGRSLWFERRRFIKSCTPDNRQVSIDWGETVAREVIKLRIRDGAEDAKSLFYPAQYPKQTGPLAWSPTGPFYSADYGPAFDSFERGYRPGWGAQKPWVISSVNQYDAVPFSDLGSMEFKQQLEKVKEIGAGESLSRSDEQSEIALFWEDGPRGITVAGHFLLIAMPLLQAQQLTPKQQAKMLATLSLALADASIVAWHNKYKTDVIRPETAIRFADSRFANSDLAKYKDAHWRSFIPTPAFPTYVSGHSVLGAAAAETLALMLGTDSVSVSSVSPDQINWRQLKGVKRSWNSLRAIAEENGVSREYGGVHWELDNTEGLRLGYQVAKAVFNKDFLLGS